MPKYFRLLRSQKLKDDFFKAYKADAENAPAKHKAANRIEVRTATRKVASDQPKTIK